MAPRRPDRITRSGALYKTPVSTPVARGLGLRRMMLTTTRRRFLDGPGDTEKQQEYSQDKDIP
jgi:hypothetical protein